MFAGELPVRHLVQLGIVERHQLVERRKFAGVRGLEQSRGSRRERGSGGAIQSTQIWRCIFFNESSLGRSMGEGNRARAPF